MNKAVCLFRPSTNGTAASSSAPSPSHSTRSSALAAACSSSPAVSSALSSTSSSASLASSARPPRCKMPRWQSFVCGCWSTPTALPGRAGQSRLKSRRRGYAPRRLRLWCLPMRSLEPSLYVLSLLLALADPVRADETEHHGAAHDQLVRERSSRMGSKDSVYVCDPRGCRHSHQLLSASRGESPSPLHM